MTALATETGSLARTRTGGFGIGFRRMWWDWQKDDSALVAYAREAGFACVDIKGDDHDCGRRLLDTGLGIGTVDLPAWRELCGQDADARAAACDTVAEHLRTWQGIVGGSMRHFAVLLPPDASQSRAETLAYAVESFGCLAPVFAETDAKLAIEGWPGPGAICCTPESYGAFFAARPEACFGINYDPSHLIRMGIDPLRFLREHLGRVFHLHGKDTAIDVERRYQLGTEIGATGEGAGYWRYCVPGHGLMAWSEAFRILVNAGYSGCISLEHEDGAFMADEAAQRLGQQLSLEALRGM